MSVQFSIDNRIRSFAEWVNNKNLINKIKLRQNFMNMPYNKRCLTGEKNYQKILSLIEIIFYYYLPPRVAYASVLFHEK